MTADDLEQHLWPAFHRAMNLGLTEADLDLAMAAMKDEGNKWIGHQGWDEPIAAIVSAALRAIAMRERV